MNPTLSPNPVTDLNQLLTFPFMVHALEAGTLVAVTAAVVGWFMVLRRESFAGHLQDKRQEVFDPGLAGGLARHLDDSAQAAGG